MGLPHFHFNKTNTLVFLVLVFLLFYPQPLEISGVTVVNDFIKSRVLSLGILFLILRGIIDAYYSPRLAIIFLVTLILAPTLNFGYLVLITLITLIVMKLLKKI